MANWKDYANRAKVETEKLVGGIMQKNRHAAVMNRLRAVIRCQERAAEKEYLALGRYYYNALRDKDNPVAEEHCAKIDQIQAQLDSTLESLEQAVRDKAEAASIGVASGEDCTLFHFGGGPLEITVTRDVSYHPEDEDSEEIDLSDVESFDHDPMPEAPACPATESETPTLSPSEPSEYAEPELGTPAELDENDSLPFEG